MPVWEAGGGNVLVAHAEQDVGAIGQRLSPRGRTETLGEVGVSHLVQYRQQVVRQPAHLRCFDGQPEVLDFGYPDQHRGDSPIAESVANRHLGASPVLRLEQRQYHVHAPLVGRDIVVDYHSTLLPSANVGSDYSRREHSDDHHRNAILRGRRDQFLVIIGRPIRRHVAAGAGIEEIVVDLRGGESPAGDQVPHRVGFTDSRDADVVGESLRDQPVKRVGDDIPAQYVIHREGTGIALPGWQDDVVHLQQIYRSIFSR